MLFTLNKMDMMLLDFVDEQVSLHQKTILMNTTWWVMGIMGKMVA